jgi:hypothetical protein
MFWVKKLYEKIILLKSYRINIEFLYILNTH